MTPGLVLNKDGSLLACFEFTGIDPENTPDDSITANIAQLQRAFANFDERVTAWWQVRKRRNYAYEQGEFRNETAAKIDHLYSHNIRHGGCFSFDTKLFVLFTGQTGVDGFFDRVARYSTEEERSYTAALIGAFFDSLSSRKAMVRDTQQLAQNAANFEQMLNAFASSVPVLRFRRLSLEEHEQALWATVNPASDAMRVRKPIGAMLDSWLPVTHATVGRDILQFKAPTATRYAGILGVKEWPNDSTPMLLEQLMVSRSELTITHIIRFLGTQATRSALNDAKQYYEMTQFGVFGYAMSKLAGSVPEPQPGKHDLYLQCIEAQRRQEAEGVGYAYHNLSVTVFGKTHAEAEANLVEVTKLLSDCQFNVLRERLNLLMSWAATFPGQWALQSRYNLITTENVADASPVFGVPTGKPYSAFLSELAGQRVPPLLTVRNLYGGLSHFSPHVRQVGHALIIAPTGGGKTTFVTLVLSQFQRYAGYFKTVKTFIFDRDYSCRIATYLHAGKHIDMRSGKMQLNPFFALDDGSPDGELWLREFLIRLIEASGYTCTAEDRERIDRALRQLKGSNTVRRLSSFATLLPKNLEKELGEWLEGRPYGMFDCAVDDFSLSDWTCIEMKEILAVDRLARVFLDYAFRKIYVALDGSPTFIYLEEASFLLSNPAFQAMLDDWLKTFRKKNAFVWLTIQSLSSVKQSSILSSLVDNIFNKILLVNKQAEAHREDYKKLFGLTDDDVDNLKVLVENRDYYIIQDGISRIMQIGLNRECLAYLRSEIAVQNIFDQVREQYPDDWQERYLSAVQRMR